MRLRALYVAPALLIAVLAAQVAAAPPVTFELITEEGFPITGAQSWLEVLKDVGVSSIRIRPAKSGDRGEVKKLGTEQSPQYYVIGILTARGQLKVPGGTFTKSDRAGIKAWVENLQIDGVENLTATTGAFGLTAKQLVDVHEKLSTRVTFVTKGEKCSEVVNRIGRSLNIELKLHETASRALASDEAVAEELLGMSSGTALAAVVRPLGLVVVPIRQRGEEPQVWLVETKLAEESWPVGWPPEKAPAEVMPALFEFIKVDIEDVALSESLAAIQERLKTPFLYDHNSMARYDVDLTQSKASLPKSKTYYKKIIERLLFQAQPEKMKAELRVDEAGEPFLWITTLKR